ncbi:MAG: hypothetical protein SCK29_04480 [Bacillota bacterium]|nr:hypothetical protein [Bacillota bacterium]MDW7683359.1 hypothetical protein [Bacillota bacterium]
MVRDMIHDDELYDEIYMEEEERPQRPVRPSGGGGGGSSLKDYVIVALIAVIAVMGINNYIFARTNNSPAGYSAGGGSCCGSGGGGATLSDTELRQIGLEYYVANYNDTDVEAIVEDFGCHQEIHIYKDGELVKRIGYGNGQVYEID